MITLSDAAAAVVAGSYRYHCRVESWRAGSLLHADVPVVTATETFDRSMRVAARLELAVPKTVDGYSWLPEGDDHPLAPWGQRLRVSLGVDLGRQRVEWFTRGTFVILDAESDGDDTVTVSAGGMLTLIEEARLVSPYQPTGTLKSAIRGLVEPALTVLFDPALTDRALPTLQFEEDRLQALWDVLDAWPADARVTPEGVLEIFPAEEETSDYTPVGTVAGVTVSRGGSASREDATSAVVARGSAADGAQVQSAWFDLDPGSPTRYGGPFNPLPVPYYYFSPLLTTVPQCRDAARTIGFRRKRNTRRPFRVDCTPQPHLQAGDVVTTRDGRNVVIEAGTLPYRPGQGAMQLTVREAPA